MEHLSTSDTITIIVIFVLAILVPLGLWRLCSQACSDDKQGKAKANLMFIGALAVLAVVFAVLAGG